MIGRMTPSAQRNGPLAGGGAGTAAIALLVIAVVAMMIVPLPTGLLDVLLVANLALAVTVLLAAVYAKDALAIASFPTVLVLTTLLRLGLSVSTTRLILVQADAGRVVRAFGSFVVRGDYVAGAAVFLILTIVQYLVIARGAERVAEVAARFTLDAMPGKQLAIDGDLRAGAIDAEEARRRRRALSREAQLYGALDGAMRFVKGDAIAGILILVVSIVGGLVTGLLQRNMGLGDAARLYTLLTIGDGLVMQLPALLISTAAGLVVTRVSGEDGDAAFGSQMLRQILGRPRTLGLVALLLVGLALVPGLPLLPFLLVALPFAVGALAAFGRRPEPGSAQVIEPAAHPGLELVLDPALAAAVGPGLDGECERATRAVVDDLGLPLPRAALVTDEGLPPRGWAVRWRGAPLAEGVIPDGKLLAETTPERLIEHGVEGEATVDPATRRPASWVVTSAGPALERSGITVRDAASCLLATLGGVLRRHARDLVGLDETQRLLDRLAQAQPALVREVVPRRVDVVTVSQVLRRLVAEGVPIGDLREILEALASAHPEDVRDPAALAERVRQALRRQITRRLAPGRQIGVIALDPMIEETLREALRGTRGGQVLALEPALVGDILGGLARALAGQTGRTAILTTPELRRHVRRLVEDDHPGLPVITFQELDPDVQVETVGRVVV